MGVSGIAQAAEPNPTPTNANTGNESPPVSIMAADGYFYVNNYWYSLLIGSYATQGNSTRWPDSVRNKGDIVINNGYVGGRDHVNIYWGSYYSGAYACISYGTAWDLRQEWQYFNWVRDGDYRGWMELVHDNAASHKWVYYCGDNTW